MSDWELFEEEIAVLECEIDDLSPEDMAWAIDYLRQKDVIDVLSYPVHSKKGRYGTSLRVLTRTDNAKEMARVIVWATGTLGVRVQKVKRFVAERSFREQLHSDNPFLNFRIKLSKIPPDLIREKPEFEDLKKISEQLHLPIWHVREQLAEAWALKRAHERSEENSN